MRSHLTRRVLRQILADEPIVHRGCLRRRAHHSLQPHHQSQKGTALQNGPSLLPRPQKRTFFDLGMFGRKRENAKEADMDPGIDSMRELERLKRLRARLPPAEEVADAVKRFFASCRSKKRIPEDNQVQLAYHSIHFCLDHERKPAEAAVLSEKLLSPTFFKMVARSVRDTPSPSDTHLRLARLAYDELKDESPAASWHAAIGLVKLLGRSGQPLQAREFVEQYEARLPETQREQHQHRDAWLEEKEQTLEMDDADADASMAAGVRAPLKESKLVALWNCVLRGYASGDDEVELLKTLEMIQRRGLGTGSGTPYAMLDFYIRADQSNQIKDWFLRGWQTRAQWSSCDDFGVRYHAKQLDRVLRWCIRNDELSFGHDLVRQAMSDNPPKVVWDSIFVWAAGTGKGPDEIDRMLSVMERSNKAIIDPAERRIPDATTINTLVEFAVSKRDPYLAERFIAVGKERGIQPDARTYVLQMQYRLSVNDVDGALIAYTNLQSMDLSSNEDIPTASKLIVALCKGRQHDFDTIMNVVADLADRKVRFDPEVATTLALLHLNRDEIHDVMDLLNTHAFHYSSTEREDVRTAIVDFCINPKTPTSRAWDGYTILRDIFDETPRTQLTALITDFFGRERPDMAVHIFNSMRRNSRSDVMPTLETYATVFLACARLRDLDILEVLHNQLKLDFNINANTYLYNTLMIGHTACGRPRRALEFWDTIVTSREGPTYNSIHIALRACEKTPFGDLKAQEIWQKLRKMKVELDQNLWSSYVAALAGNGDNELAIATVQEAEAKGEVEIDAFLIGSVLLGASGHIKQAEIQAWAKEMHPSVWADLEKMGVEVDETGRHTVKIDRSISP